MSNNLNLPFLAADLKKLESSLLSHLDSRLDITKIIGSHIIESGGKRIRPILLFLTLYAFGAKQEDANLAKLACVIEYVHNATLLHDDVVDKASMRRNRVTASSKWGNSQAILVGDFLFTKAFELLSDLNNTKLMSRFATVTNKLTIGELLQLQATPSTMTQAIYFEIVQAKTAILIASCMEFAGIYTNQEEATCATLYDIGLTLGTAFQLVDDALDYTADSSLLGKTAGIDLKEHKVTLPLFYLLDKATSQEKEQVQAILHKDTLATQDVQLVQTYMTKYNCIEDTLTLSQNYITNAIDKLRTLQNNEYINTIIELSQFIIKRKY